MVSFFSSFSFSKLMSHVFPGFFFAFMLFMLVDYFYERGSLIDQLFILTLGPDNSLIIITIIITIVLIIGTVLGIIIDGIQHNTITNFYKNNRVCKEYKDVYNAINKLTFKNFCEKNKINTNELSKFHETDDNDNSNIVNWYFYLPLIDNEKFYYYNNEFYYYYEFFANMSIVLIPMSFITLLYTTDVLEIPNCLSFFIFVFILTTGIFCVYNAQKCFEVCCKVRINIILGTLCKKS